MVDTDQDRVQRGHLAAQVRQELQRRVTERTESMLNDAITKARTSTGLSGEDAKAVLLAIGNMRLLLADANRDVRQGEEAQQRLMSPGRA